MENTDTGIYLILGSVVIISGYYYSIQLPSQYTQIMVVTVILLCVLAYSAFNQREKFYFEVSPRRAACLKEQVSRNNFGKKRTSCGCCGRGTKGGIPPNYAEWLNNEPDTTHNRWHRPDFVEYVSTFSNAEESICKGCNPPSYINYI